jgi:poly-gamma-glutamate capsule biosynthesis protein CapA/YwtB (metallophosphatase superfamily)
MYRDKPNKSRKLRKIFLPVLLIIIFCGLLFGAYKLFLSDTPEQKLENNLSFGPSVSFDEQQDIRNAIFAQSIVVQDPVTVNVKYTKAPSNDSLVSEIFVPVTNIYSVRQKLTSEELITSDIKLYADSSISADFVNTLGLTSDKVELASGEIIEPEPESIAFVPIDNLAEGLKLLEFDNQYYLDTFSSGALFREASFEGQGASALAGLELNKNLKKEQILKSNITGVTALTRVMLRKLNSVADPLYFAKEIGSFLADADLTHVSNEVSFKEDCSYNETLFCSPSEFIETLKASGVDLVEITGNHNNDFGATNNSNTINLYKSLGWGVVGGGLDEQQAKAPYLYQNKNTSITYLAYNYPDSPNGNAIAGTNTAGANRFDFELTSIQADIVNAKQNSDFVQVNIQFWECYAYPAGYVEYPECDKPIGDQEAIFKSIIDLGADMVVGTSAHQPQTFEIYKGKPIYYGLGNLYFDQTSWPGTERGIILTNYFLNGKLIQTKLTPTVYDRDLQTRIMTDEETEYLLTRLRDARLN